LIRRRSVGSGPPLEPADQSAALGGIIDAEPIAVPPGATARKILELRQR